jgi:hypothetical protein
VIDRTPPQLVDELCLRTLDNMISDPEYCTRTDGMAKSMGIDKDMVIALLRELKRRGHADFFRGLFTEDGDVAGAGYAPTRAGLDALRKSWKAPIVSDSEQEL